MPDKPDYTALDAAILDLIRRGDGCSCHRLVDLLDSRYGELMAAALCDAQGRPAEYRLVKRRLQALRKAGRIRYGQLDWTIR